MESGYDFYLDKCLLPVPPGRLRISIKNENRTLRLINEGSINLLKAAGLTELEFDCMLPQVEYPFAVYRSGFRSAGYYLEYFEKLKTAQKPFQFIVTRRLPGGNPLFGTNMKVSMEEYRISEDAGDGFDPVVTVKLKQYRDYGTKSVSVKGVETGKETGGETAVRRVSVKPDRAQENAPEVNRTRNYTVLPGDTLFGIAKQLYGDGSRYMDIYNANRAIIKGGPLDMKPGQKLRIPALQK